MTEQQSKKKKKKGGKVPLIICLVIIIVLLAILLFFLLGRDDSRNVVVNEDNVEEVLSNLEEPVAPGYYEVTMNSTWHFADGKSASDNAYVENAKTNTNSVYFDVVRTDTDETIYESPILPVGSHLEEITLDSELPAGTYDCLLTYHLLDEEEKSTSTLNMTVTIVVEK